MRLAALAKPLETPAVRLAKRRRHDDLGQLAPEHFFPAVAEGPFRRWIELGDPSFFVGGDDAVEGGFEDGALARIALEERLLREAVLLLGRAPAPVETLEERAAGKDEERHGHDAG